MSTFSITSLPPLFRRVKIKDFSQIIEADHGMECSQLPVLILAVQSYIKSN